MGKISRVHVTCTIKFFEKIDLELFEESNGNNLSSEKIYLIEYGVYVFSDLFTNLIMTITSWQNEIYNNQFFSIYISCM